MDKYDKAIAHLKENPTLILNAWRFPGTYTGGCLFQFAGPLEGNMIGCLTQIRGGGYYAETPALTEEIMNDTRIPVNDSDITVNDLEVFAEWQRILDKELPSRQQSEDEAQA